MQLRLLTQEEYPIIQQLANEIWPVCYAEILSQEQLKYMLDLFYTPEALKTQAEKGQEFYLLEENQEPLGFLGIQRNYPETGDLRIHKIYVRMNYHGSGFGKFMLKWAENEAFSKGFSRIHLNVNRFNKAKSFYEKNGFEILFSEDIEIGKGYLMEDYVMVKKF